MHISNTSKTHMIQDWLLFQHRRQDLLQKPPEIIHDSLHLPKPTCKDHVKQSAPTSHVPSKNTYAYLLCTSVLAIWRCVATGTTAPTRNLTIVVVFHEALVTFAPASLQPHGTEVEAVHNQLIWKQKEMLHSHCYMNLV